MNWIQKGILLKKMISLIPGMNRITRNFAIENKAIFLKRYKRILI